MFLFHHRRNNVQHNNNNDTTMIHYCIIGMRLTLLRIVLSCLFLVAVLLYINNDDNNYHSHYLILHVNAGWIQTSTIKTRNIVSTTTIATIPMRTQDSNQKYPSIMLYAIQDETKEQQELEEQVITTTTTNDKEIYRNGVAKFLSNFMSSSSSTKSTMNEIVTTTQDDDNENEQFYLQRRLESMKDVYMKQQTDEYWDQPKVRNTIPIDILIQALDYELYYNEWFVTGNVNPIYFSKTNFIFQDPDVNINTIQSYAYGVQKIFDIHTVRAEIISTKLKEQQHEQSDDIIINNNNTAIITCTWRLSGKVNIGPGLTIKPYIINTDFTIDVSNNNNTGLIIQQIDTFTIPSWDILLSSLFPFVIGRITSLPAPKPKKRYPIMPDITPYIK